MRCSVAGSNSPFQLIDHFDLSIVQVSRDNIGFFLYLCNYSVSPSAISCYRNLLGWIHARSNLWEWVSLLPWLPFFYYQCPIDQTVGGRIADGLGRVHAARVVSIPFIIGTLMCASATDMYILCAGRLITGICKMTELTIVYMADILFFLFSSWWDGYDCCPFGAFGSFSC